MFRLKRHLFFLMVGCLSLFSCQTSSQSTDSCRTPNNVIGECINVRECPSLLALLQGPRPILNHVVDFLRRSQCGFEGRNPFVCCPDHIPPAMTTTTRKPPQTKPTTKMPQPMSSGRPIDVRGNPKLRLLPEVCGIITENRIIGGNETALFEFPWMVLLGYASPDSPETIQYRCGGTLINRHYVLTAAHCVAFLYAIELVEVRLGEHDLRTEEDCDKEAGCAPPVQDFAIERVTVHPQYFKDELRNDIALIRLKGAARLSKAVQPICLPVGPEQSKKLESEKVTVTGWGATEYGTGSQILLKVDLPIMPHRECAAIYDRSVPITEKQLCAGGLSGHDSCGGDSGGPLSFVGQPTGGGLSYIQYGIVSFGPRQCGTKGRPGVYTRVGYYMDWILSNIRP